MTEPRPTQLDPSNAPPRPTHASVRRESSVLDLPLIIEQLQDQIDQLHATVQAQRAVIEQHAALLAALKRN